MVQRPPGSRRMRLRTGIRALVLDPDDRIVLVRFEFPARSFWATPGGGVEEGEDDAATLGRELREELGLELVEPLGRCVWVRTHVVPMGAWDGQTERYYLLRTPAFEIRPALSPEELRREGVTEVRWWTLDELRGAKDVVFAPRRLPVLLPELLRDGPPSEPLDVGV
jgi:8-oxo-dGTP diphosphatase